MFMISADAITTMSRQSENIDTNSSRNLSASTVSTVFPVVGVQPLVKDCGNNITTELGDVPLDKCGRLFDTYKQTTESRVQRPREWFIDLHACKEGRTQSFSGPKIFIRGFSGAEKFQDFVPLLCNWSIIAPRGQYLVGRVNILDDPCNEEFTITASTVLFFDAVSTTSKFLCDEARHFSPVIVESQLHFMTNKLWVNKHHLPNFTIHFEATSENVREKLDVIFTSADSGYVVPWGYDGIHQVLCNMNASVRLTAPETYSVMVSVPVYSNPDWTGCSLWLHLLHLNGSKTEVLRIREPRNIPPHIFWTSLFIHFVTVDPPSCTLMGIGFKLLFSFHNASHTPVKLDNGLFECSTPLYETFRQHLHCNLEKECKGGEDEGGHCPFSSEACEGAVASGDKCYRLFQPVLSRPLEWNEARQYCKRHGGELAMMKTYAEWEDFSKLYTFGKISTNAFIGLHTGYSTSPDLYKRTLKWADGSVAQIANISYTSFQNLLHVSLRFFDRYCAIVKYIGTVIMIFPEEPCFVRYTTNAFTCQIAAKWTESKAKETLAKFPSVSLPSIAMHISNIRLFLCPKGHMTHECLSCDWQSRCTRQRHLAACPVHVHAATEDEARASLRAVAMFPCDDQRQTLHYMLVCDFRPDCDDASDETFCVHTEQCEGFTCDNGQCLPHDKRCDSYRDCWDGSDELCVKHKKSPIPVIARFPPPVLINFNSTGHLSQQRLDPRHPMCPETHFSCSDGYCLPVYVFCNAVVDCPSREDEQHCQHHQCPGFYRCRSSHVCVHLDHLCDGWPQCPQHDDEWLCHVTCPPQCFCHGLAFLCPRPFPAHHFTQLRYLDAAGSTMTLDDVQEDVYLTWLSLASCGVRYMQEVDLPNLRVLDLSSNLLSTLHMNVLHKLSNLKDLRLAKNSLSAIADIQEPQTKGILNTLDFSHNVLDAFPNRLFFHFPHIVTLNISFNRISVVKANEVSVLQNLIRIDIRGNALKHYPKDIFQGLSRLKNIHSDDFRLCCKSALHKSVLANGSCIAPEDEISSCDDLLKTESYRVFMWFVVISIFTGNLVFLSIHLRTTFSNALNILLINLTVADLLMGVYVLSISSADAVYQGRFHSVEDVWRLSAICKAVGSLSVLSFELSLFLTLLLAVERHTALFPLRAYHHFHPLCAAMASSVCWAVALVIVVVTLLPVTSHWEFYSQNGICSPLPAPVRSFPGEKYAFGVRTVLNSMLCVLVIVGHGFQVWSLRPSSAHSTSVAMATEVSRARRVSYIIMTEVMTHFILAMIGLHGDVHENINLFAAMCVLPFNASINPCLYFISNYYEKRRKRNEAKLIQKLKSKTLSATMVGTPST